MTRGRRRARLAGILWATLAAVSWGSATVMSKGALDHFPPMALLSIQLTASVATLWTLLLLRGVAAAAVLDALRFAWLGLLEPGAAYVLSLFGLARTTAASATLIGASESIAIAILSSVLLRERLSSRFLLLSFLALCGLTLALGVTSTVAAGGWLGDALIIAGTLTAAVYVVLSGRVVADRDPILLVACQQLAACAFAFLLLPAELVEGERLEFSTLSSSTWLLALGSGIVQYALAFSLYLTAMRRIATSLAGAFLNLVPVIGLAGAVVFLGETITATQLVGAALTIGSLVLLSRTAGEAQP